MQDQDTPPAFLTTREVAELLRVRERKVYDMAAAGEIPHRRITGKLLFPHSEITEWLAGTAPAPERPMVLTGSHDPLLDWALREADTGLATLVNGSREGLTAFADGRAALAGLHLPEAAGWNVETVAALGLRDCVLLGFARRARGLLVSPALAGQIKGFAGLRGRRVVLRQPGAGAATLFDSLLAEAGMGLDDLIALPGFARTESDAAAAVAAGEADAALGVAAMAQTFNLAFVPLCTEHFDLLIDRRAYFRPPVQRLLAFAGGPAMAAKAKAMGGYDLGDLGAVRWLSP
jgi:excisionase family DNA binding protein